MWVWSLEVVPVAWPARQVVHTGSAPTVLWTVVVSVVTTELCERDATVGADRLFPSGRFKDWLSDSDCDPMFARTLLIGVRRTRAITRDTALDMNPVRMVVVVLVRVVDHLYVTVTEKRERKRLPLRSLLGRYVGVEYVYYIGGIVPPSLPLDIGGSISSNIRSISTGLDGSVGRTDSITVRCLPIMI